jgi:PAS domain S-box-containing protein
MNSDEPPRDIEQLLGDPDLAEALGSDQFKQILDHVPVAIAVSELNPTERIVYSNEEFARLIGQAVSDIVGRQWEHLPGEATAAQDLRSMGEVVVEGRDYIGAYAIARDGASVIVDAWSSVIEDDAATPVFRLVALVETAERAGTVLDELEARVREKDTQLRELQHRVKNNLQMITALIRVEAKGVADRTTTEGYDRLAGRVEALGVLYRLLSDAEPGEGVDLGVYLSAVASAVMRAHAVEGIHLDLQVDTWPVSIDVAMPTGLVVNELLTNALKHAFTGREGGTIVLHSTNGPDGCRVVVADDGVGLPEGATWPRPGKLSALIVRSLLHNAKARFDVQSAPGEGTRITIAFRPENAAPAAEGLSGSDGITRP